MPGQHYQQTSRGIILLKSGHHRLRLHILHSEDRGGTVAALIEQILLHGGFADDTFDAPSRPASIFRALSRKCIDLLPESYLPLLRRRLLEGDAEMAARVARLLVQIYDTAESYPDLQTFLNCYFRVDGVSPDKFARYAKGRLLDAGEDMGTVYEELRSELRRFSETFHPPTGDPRNRRSGSKAGFMEAMEWLEIKLERLKARLESLPVAGDPALDADDYRTVA